MNQQECTANHDVLEQCMSCGWTRKPHQHTYTVVVEWKEYKGEEFEGKWYPYHDGHTRKVATKVMCESCADIKKL